MILMGTLLAAGATLLIMAYALAGRDDASMLIYLFFPMNIGLGLRGPPGFFHAIGAGGGERTASLAILVIMVVSALGTALLARLCGAPNFSKARCLYRRRHTTPKGESLR